MIWGPIHRNVCQVLRNMITMVPPGETLRESLECRLESCECCDPDNNNVHLKMVSADLRIAFGEDPSDLYGWRLAVYNEWMDINS